MRFLFTTWEGGGNVAPAMTLASQLVRRGHAVRVMSDEANRGEAEAAGAAFIPWTTAPNRPDRSRASDPVRDWEAASPPEGLGCLFRAIVTGPSAAYARDTIAELKREPADLVVTSEMLLGVIAGCESQGQRAAVFSANLCMYPLPGMPVFGPGLPPPVTPEDHALHDQVRAGTIAMFDELGLADLNRARAGLDLRPLTHLHDQVQSLEAYLLGASQAFDFPSDPPPLIRYVGPQLGEPSWAGQWTSPFEAADDRPLVLAGFSTTFQGHAGVLQRVIDAAADLPVRLLVTLGGLEPGEIAPAANARVVDRAPHGAVMLEAAIVVTHGGHGTVTRGLVHGLPMLVVPHGRDQDDNAVRVAVHGAGLALPPAASTGEIRAALVRLLGEPDFRAVARRLGGEIRRDMTRSTAVADLEGLAAGRPLDVSGEDGGVDLGLEADGQAPVHIEDGPLDHRRLGDHQRDGLVLVDALLVGVGKRPEGRAGPVEQHVPADLAGPGLQRRRVDPDRLVVVEGVGDAAPVEPGPRLLHGVAGLDAVQGDGSAHGRLIRW